MVPLSGGKSLDAADRRRLAHPAVGGVILFARNFSDAEQLRSLSADIRRASKKKMLLAADQEGGRVQRFRGADFFSLPPMRKVAARGDENLLRDAGAVMAAELAVAGMDMSFAPVLDLARGRSRVIGDRAFAAAHEDAARFAMAFAEGMRAAGMASCGKHFPGHGHVRADSHVSLPSDGRSFAEIAAADLMPFARWAERDMPALMTAHVVYPKCDSHVATYSRFWLRKILRNKLKYGGMVVSDDLSMEGAGGASAPQKVAAALEAGCDGALICTPDAADDVLAAAKVRGTQNPWLALSLKTDGAMCAGDFAFREARVRLAEAFPQ